MKLTLSNIMDEFDLHLTDVSTIFKIPYSTVQKWYYNVSTPPEYVLRMMRFVIINAYECKHMNDSLDKAKDLLHDNRIEEAIEIIDNI